MGRSQDRKGAEGERDAAKNLQRYYHADDAERAPRKDRGDLEGSTVHGVNAHVEVKNLARHAVYQHVEQAVRQKQDGDWPLVMLKGNYKRNWLYVIRDVDVQNFVRGYLINRGRTWTEPTSPTRSSSSRVSTTLPLKLPEGGDTWSFERLVEWYFEEWRPTRSSSSTSMKSTGSEESAGIPSGPEAESG